MTHPKGGQRRILVHEWQRTGTAQSAGVVEREELNLKTTEAHRFSARDSLRLSFAWSSFLKHSSCGLVESLTTQMTTDETVNKR